MLAVPHQRLDGGLADFETGVEHELGQRLDEGALIDVAERVDGGGADGRVLGSLSDLQDELRLAGPPFLAELEGPRAATRTSARGSEKSDRAGDASMPRAARNAFTSGMVRHAVSSLGQSRRSRMRLASRFARRMAGAPDSYSVWKPKTTRGTIRRNDLESCDSQSSCLSPNQSQARPMR